MGSRIATTAVIITTFLVIASGCLRADDTTPTSLPTEQPSPSPLILTPTPSLPPQHPSDEKIQEYRLSTKRKISGCTHNYRTCIEQLTDEEKVYGAEELFPLCDAIRMDDWKEGDACYMRIAVELRDSRVALLYRICTIVQGRLNKQACGMMLNAEITNLTRRDPEEAIRVMDEVGGAITSVALILAENYTDKAVEICNRGEPFEGKKYCIEHVAARVAEMDVYKAVSVCHRFNTTDENDIDFCLRFVASNFKVKPGNITSMEYICHRIISDSSKDRCYVFYAQKTKVLDT